MNCGRRILTPVDRKPAAGCCNSSGSARRKWNVAGHFRNRRHISKGWTRAARIRPAAFTFYLKRPFCVAAIPVGGKSYYPARPPFGSA